MRRGFKAEAERIAVDVRERLNLSAMAAVDPWTYAKLLGVVVLDFETLGVGPKEVRQLLNVDPDGWSGLTLKEDDRYFVVLNPVHARVRQVSTMMHELAHIQLKHSPKRVDISDAGLMLLSDYPADQEEEADWLSASVLLPRDALCHYRSLGWSTTQICTHYGVSTPLCEWRLRMTGVDIQLRRRRA